MEQGVLSHQYFSQKPIQFPPRSLSLNIDVNSGRNRCNSADSIHETSGYSSATTSLDGTYSMKEPNPFFGTFNTQNYTSTRKPISSAYYSHSSGQRGHNQADINEYEQRSQSEVSPASDGSFLASDDDMGYSPTTSDPKTSKGRKPRKPPKSNKSTKICCLPPKNAKSALHKQQDMYIMEQQRVIHVKHFFADRFNWAPHLNTPVKPKEIV